MSAIDTLDEWREIAEEQTYQIEEAVKCNLPPDIVLRAHLDELPDRRPADLQNPDRLYGLTFWVTYYCAKHHPAADPMVFDDVYRLIAKAHAVDQLTDFIAEYPSPELVGRTFRRAMLTWAIVRDRIIEHERCAPAQSNAIQPDVVHNAVQVDESITDPTPSEVFTAIGISAETLRKAREAAGVERLPGDRTPYSPHELHRIAIARADIGIKADEAERWKKLLRQHGCPKLHEPIKAVKKAVAR